MQVGCEVNIKSLMKRLESAGITLWERGGDLRFRAPKGGLSEALKRDITTCKAEIIRFLRSTKIERGDLVVISEGDDGKPFSLTDLQQAYVVGEEAFFDYHTPAYFYQEYQIEALDVDRLRRAIVGIIVQHDALRTVEVGEGRQQVATFDRDEALKEIDISNLSREEAERTLEDFRRKAPVLAGKVSSVPHLFAVVHRLPVGYRLHIFMRLFAVDGLSIKLIQKELIELYEGKRINEPRRTTCFRGYAKALYRHKESDRYKKSLGYWMQRLESMPLAPQLPTSWDAKKDGVAIFSRLTSTLQESGWKRFKEHCKQAGVSVNMALCTLFADVVRRWSTNSSFTLNMMYSYRPVTIPEVMHLVGNCSSTTLLEVSNVVGSFGDRARKLQTQALIDAEHNIVSGVTVIREFARMRRGAQDRPSMPIVFTSGIGLGSENAGFRVRKDGWENVHSSLQTPQVWLDHQVYEEDGCLMFNWDYVPQAFPPQMVDEMFTLYRQALDDLSCRYELWEEISAWELPPALICDRIEMNSSGRQFDLDLLHSNFARLAHAIPEKEAIYSDDRVITYGELYRRSTLLASSLIDNGVSRNSIVAVLARKGWKQVVAVLAILQAGGIYLPLDRRFPKSRVGKILRHSAAVGVLVDDEGEAMLDGERAVFSLVIPDTVDFAAPLRKIQKLQSLSDPAYVIYTSGSTGEPKGVVISHAAAMNTILDVVDRFDIRAEDRIVALSALNFDLSVFDIFGSLNVGAALVYPRDSDSPDPQAWIDAISAHGVTVWNSVPAFIDMLLEFALNNARQILKTVRVLMLSGDWVSLKLIDRIRDVNRTSVIVALGGATEASIWSNYFVVDELDYRWKSVPYGYPLANQRLHVLDDNMRDVPVWVEGDLYIGGDGLALGYLNDSARTDAQFVVHPRSGERLYKTGDMARYLPDGIIEFHGRKDFQVKIRGYRIELGEIEACLLRVPEVEAAVAFVDTGAQTSQQLTAAVVSRSGARIDTKALITTLSAQLPSYMVPSRVCEVSSLPLSANGKVDRKKLAATLPESAAAETAHVDPRDMTETAVSEIWKKLLGLEKASVTDNFFAVGGNSLLAVRLMNEIEKELGVRLPLSTLFRSGTVERIAELVSSQRPIDERSYVLIREGGKADLFLVHPVGGSLLCYNTLVQLLSSKFTVHGLQCVSSARREAAENKLENVAAQYVAEVERVCPSGRICLAGWSMGGTLAFEIGRQLREKGRDVGTIVMIDSWVGLGDAGLNTGMPELTKGFVRDLAPKLYKAGAFEPLERLPESEYLAAAVQILKDSVGEPIRLDLGHVSQLADVYAANYKALLTYAPRGANLGVHYFAARGRSGFLFTGLRPFVDDVGNCELDLDDIVVDALDEDHFSIITQGATRIAEALNGFVA